MHSCSHWIGNAYLQSGRVVEKCEMPAFVAETSVEFVYKVWAVPYGEGDNVQKRIANQN